MYQASSQIIALLKRDIAASHCLSSACLAPLSVRFLLLAHAQAVRVLVTRTLPVALPLPAGLARRAPPQRVHHGAQLLQVTHVCPRVGYARARARAIDGLGTRARRAPPR